MDGVLAEPFYSQAHEVFRRATNQTELMLDHLAEQCRGYRRMKVLSVGSGTGLFELPMLRMLQDRGTSVSRFVGVDPSLNALAKLGRSLDEAFGEELEYELVPVPFEQYETSERFDMVLFNHVFEYLTGEPLAWAHEARSLKAEGGMILIFSPLRGGINKIYEEVFTEARGASPLFADDIDRVLSGASIPFASLVMTAKCDVTSLHRKGSDPEKLMLLSFLTQTDCRVTDWSTREGYVDYYLSLREPGADWIPHPAALFVI